MSNVKPAPGFIDKGRATQLLEKWAPVLDYSSDKVRPIEDEHARVTTAMLVVFIHLQAISHHVTHTQRAMHAYQRF